MQCVFAVECGLYCNRFQRNLFIYGSIHGDDGSENTYMSYFTNFCLCCNDPYEEPMMPTFHVFRLAFDYAAEAQRRIVVQAAECKRYCPSEERK